MSTRPKFIKHNKCNGTGYGSKVYASCRGCKGTGRASVAFEILLGKQPLVQHTSLDEDVDFDWVLDKYITAVHGSTSQVVRIHPEDDEERYKAVLVTVLQHSVNRGAARTVWRLGGVEPLFAYLVEQEKLHMRGVKCGDYQWC